MHGYNFCRGAKKAVGHLMSNVIRVAAIKSVGGFTLILGQILVLFIVCVIGEAIVDVSELNQMNIHHIMYSHYSPMHSKLFTHPFTHVLTPFISLSL